jgi:hypothetical protein
MDRRPAAVLAVLALLLGFAAAPYTHFHSSAAAGHHHGDDISPGTASNAPLVHSHRASHVHGTHTEQTDVEHDGAPANEHDVEQIWAVDGFIFQVTAAPQASVPVVLSYLSVHADADRVGIGRPVVVPPAHGPPFQPATALRAPPAFPPVLI